ncbi:MAG: CGNR zinc finger domain-containing protein [Methylobacterium mesophilicum]|nr:CGNR zinc finger domain-containing protein [Methylobacterium mesophilicum]
MPIEWNAHRFSGGAFALDVANTVVLRNRPELRFDRFADRAEILRFAEAACVHRENELAGSALDLDDRDCLIALRESTDALFRKAVLAERPPAPDELPLFLRSAADAIEKGGGFGRALAASALSLLDRKQSARLRICAHCAWLFLDRSRNGSRIWCDMAVCGNRAKAQRHYRRQTDRDHA